MPFLLDNDLVANIALGMDKNYDLKNIQNIKNCRTRRFYKRC